MLRLTAMSFPAAGPSPSLSSGCSRLPPAEDAGTWAFYTPRQAKALEILAAPAAASGDWGTGRGRDDLQRLTILSLLRN